MSNVKEFKKTLKVYKKVYKSFAKAVKKCDSKDELTALGEEMDEVISSGTSTYCASKQIMVQFADWSDMGKINKMIDVCGQLNWVVEDIKDLRNVVNDKLNEVSKQDD